MLHIAHHLNKFRIERRNNCAMMARGRPGHGLCWAHTGIGSIAGAEAQPDRLAAGVSRWQLLVRVAYLPPINSANPPRISQNLTQNANVRAGIRRQKPDVCVNPGVARQKLLDSAVRMW
jgi:hypothetical protein